MAYNIENAKKVLAALIAAGANPIQLPLLMSQVAHETGDFDSRVFKANNNASGIMYINKPEKQKNAKKGLPFPKREGKYFYAHFASLKDWAADFMRIVSGAIRSSTTFQQYALALKKRKYYADQLSNYTKALKSHYAALVKVFPELKNSNVSKEEANKSLNTGKKLSDIADNPGAGIDGKKILPIALLFCGMIYLYTHH